MGSPRGVPEFRPQRLAARAAPLGFLAMDDGQRVDRLAIDEVFIKTMSPAR
jgi:hypothetical protein